MRRAFALFVLSSLPALAHGQVCLGHTAYAAGAIKGTAGLEVGNGGAYFWGGPGIGRPRSWFAGATAGLLTGDGASSFGLGGMAGLELKKPITGKLEFCPMVGIRHQFGDGSFTDYIAEAAATYPLGSGSGNTRLMLAGDYQGILEKYSVTPGTAEEWYGNLDLGVAVLVNQRFSLVPQVRIPIRYGGGRDISFIVRGSVNFGGK